MTSFHGARKMDETRLLVLIVLHIVLLCNYCETKTILDSEDCGPYRIKIVRDDTITCFSCPVCPVGSGLSIRCGSVSTRNKNAKIGCLACTNGKTFSDSHSTASCKQCRRCGNNHTIKRNCTPEADTECMLSKSICRKGFYYSEMIFGCLPCTQCCQDNMDIKIDECATQEAHKGQICSVRSAHRCERRKNINPDKENMIEIIVEKRIDILKPTSKTTTVRFPNISNYNHRIFIHNRTTKDIHLDLPNPRYPFLLLLVIIMSIVLSLVCILFFTVLATKNRKWKKVFKGQCFPMRLPTRKNKNNPGTCRGDQSDELEDWSNNDITSGNYSFKCGLLVEYDPSCIQDRFKDLVVETLNDEYLNNSNFRDIEPGQVFLSPVFRFYPKGEKFEKPVNISLPHSALWTSDQRNWEIEILCMDERKQNEAKWEKVEDGVQINWKDASFRCDTLLTYAVVGRPKTGAKKRMQFVVFAMNEMISDLFEVVIYLLDDNETSFERVLKENKSKGFSMLGSFYAAFVDLYSLVDITIHVQGLLDGWELDDDRSSPKTICSSDCADSYFKIPSFKAVFRRIKRGAEKFNCQFAVDIAGSAETIIPAFTFLPEEELCVKVDIHDKDHSSIKESKTLFIDLPYNTKYIMSHLLDVSVQGQRTWRHLARHYGLAADELELFSLQYATLEGSPTRALFDYLHASRPNLTVGDVAKCLESMGREDVVSVLYKNI